VGTNSDRVYEDLIARGKSVTTAKYWRCDVRRFEACCGVKGSYDRTDVIKFLTRLREDGLSQNSINTKLRPIKLLCQIQNWNGDGVFPRLSMPRVRASDISRPILSCEQVGELITRARESCSERELAFLAAATTYGLRRGEVGALVVDDGHVKVDTLKGGVVTTHLMPAKIKAYMANYRGTKDERWLTRIFQHIINKVKLDLDDGYGWHAIRRSLVTELVLREVSLLNIIRFMRWSDASAKGELGMLVIYAKKEQAKVDESIFKVHPFLPFWSEGSLTDSAVGVECL